MQNPLLQQIDAIAKEKGVEPEIIIGAVQDAIEAAARKRYKNETLRARFNTDTGQIELCSVKRIVEEVTDPPNQISLADAQQLYGDEAEVDMEVEFPRPTEDLGRIAAQTAKQVIFQKVREAERENVYAEYSTRVGEVVSGVVKRFENGDIIMELRGEKIDIVEWSDDHVQFVTQAISPAKVQRVSIVNDEERVMEVVVEDKQLSLAIGKKGQNVRLAAKLTGWKIDIKSEEEKRKEVEAQFEGMGLPEGAEGDEAAEGAQEAEGVQAAPAEVA